MVGLTIKNGDFKEDIVYDRQHFIDLGKKAAEETIDILRKNLKESSDE